MLASDYPPPYKARSVISGRGRGRESARATARWELFIETQRACACATLPLPPGSFKADHHLDICLDLLIQRGPPCPRYVARKLFPTRPSCAPFFHPRTLFTYLPTERNIARSPTAWNSALPAAACPASAFLHLHRKLC